MQLPSAVLRVFKEQGATYKICLTGESFSNLFVFCPLNHRNKEGKFVVCQVEERTN